MMDEKVPLKQQPRRNAGSVKVAEKKVSQTNQSNMTPINNKDVDGGWAWVVLITSYLSRIIMGGMFWAISIYFVIYHEEFAESRSYTAAIGSVTFFTFHAAAPISSIMIERFGARITTIVGGILITINYVLNAFATGVLYLIFTHCLFLGVGQSFVSNASLVGLSQYFRRYVNFTTGLSLSGTGVGMFIFGRLVPYLIDLYGWRGSMLTLGGIGLHFCVFGCVLFPLKNSAAGKSKVKTNIFTWSRVKKLLSSPVLWSINFAFFAFAFSAITITVLYKDIVILYGMDTVFTWCLTIFGAGDIVGRAVSGLVTSHPKVNPAVIFGIVHLFSAAMIVLHTVAISGQSSFMALGFFLGSSVGAQIALTSIVLLAMFGREMFVLTLGYVQIFAGIGALAGPPVTGFLTDSTGTYTVGLGFIAIADIIAALSCILAYWLRKRELKAIERKLELHNGVQINLLDETKPQA